MAEISRASIVFRIGPSHWLRDSDFRRIVELLSEFEGVSDELAYFTNDTAAPLPLDTMRERVGILGERLREAGAEPIPQLIGGEEVRRCVERGPGPLGVPRVALGVGVGGP